MAADLQVQHYQGRPVLTWWQGYSGAGVGAGEDVIDDSSYRQVAVVHAANGLSADLHEFRLTPQGTALITAYYPVYWNATDVHLSDRQVVLDSVVQEIDVKTGLLLFQWDSLDHVPLTDTYEPPSTSAGAPFDYFHINSVQLQPDGNLLISARNTWAAYEVDHDTGAIMWTLGGRRSSYKLGSGAAVRVPARRASPRRHRPDRDPVRRRRRPAEDPRPVARDHRPAQRQDQDRDAREPGPALAGAGGELRGQRAGAAERRRLRRLGPAAVLHRVQLAGRRRCSTAGSWGTTRATAPTASRGSGRRPRCPRSRASAAGASTNVYVSWNGATEVSLVAGARRREPGHARRRRDRGQAGVRDPAHDPAAAVRPGPGARQRAAPCSRPRASSTL